MRQVIVRCGGEVLCVDVVGCAWGAAVSSALAARGLPPPMVRLKCGGREVSGREERPGGTWGMERAGDVDGDVAVVEAQMRLLGGKGGFGSLLRGGNGQVVKKTTNFNACRDLSGRRIRHVNQEKQLKEWYQQQEQEKMEKKSRGREQKEEAPLFDTAAFEAEQDVIEGMVSSAVKEVLTGKRTRPEACTPKKRRRPRDMDPLFAGMDSDEEDSDEEESDEKSDEKMEKMEEPEKEQEERVTDSESSSNSPSPSSSTTSSPECTPDVAVGALGGHEQLGIDLMQYESAKELEAVGLDALKHELLRLGLLCGGSLQQRAERLFSTKGKDRALWDRSLYEAKKGKKKKKGRKPIKGN